MHDALTVRAIEYWLFGGWAVDFYAGTITREHDDVDIAIWLKDHQRRVIGFDALKRGKMRSRDDPADAAKDRADSAILSRLG